jgi:CheY-like chemotaxis protein
MPASFLALRGNRETVESVRLRCLIVDDNSEFLRVASMLLGGEAIEVVGVASTSAQAMASVKELAPDVVLVDIKLGDECGLVLARELVESSDITSSVIIISTYAERDFADLIAASPASASSPSRTSPATRSESSSLAALQKGDHGQHPAVIVGGRRERELAEDRVDVLLDRALVRTHRCRHATRSPIGIEDALSAIRGGAMSATVAQYPYTIGQLGVQACLAAARGKRIPSRIDAPIQVLRRDNVARAQGHFPKPLDAVPNPLDALLGADEGSSARCRL